MSAVTEAYRLDTAPGPRDESYELDALPSRIADRIAVTPAGCWEWQGNRCPKGYGYLTWQGRRCAVYRVSYELLTGEDASAAEAMDHLCRNPSCCNPAHVEPVTYAENMRRGIQSFAFRSRCLSGRHELTPDTVMTRPRPGDGRAQCRACHNERRRERRARKRLLGLPAEH